MIVMCLIALHAKSAGIKRNRYTIQSLIPDISILIWPALRCLNARTALHCNRAQGISASLLSLMRELSMKPNVNRIVTTDALIEEAIAQGRARPPQLAVAAKYDEVKDTIVVQLKSGITMGFPRKSLQGLEDAKPEDLAMIEIEGPGTGLVWPRLDVAHYLPGLIDNVFIRDCSS